MFPTQQYYLCLQFYVYRVWLFPIGFHTAFSHNSSAFSEVITKAGQHAIDNKREQAFPRVLICVR